MQFKGVAKAFGIAIAKLARNERGEEVLEYTLIAGLFVVAVIATVAGAGHKVFTGWRKVTKAF